MNNRTDVTQRTEGKNAHPIEWLSNNPIFTREAHILYTYYEEVKYIRNAVDFLIQGLNQNHQVILVENKKVFQKIKRKALEKGLSVEELRKLHYVDNEKFYFSDNQFDMETSIYNFQDQVVNGLKEGKTIWAWGQMVFDFHKYPLSELRNYECECDALIGDYKKAVTVCTYNGISTPAYVQNEMLKVHPYFMTDDEMGTSPLYKKEYLNRPSIEEQERLSRIDQENLRLLERNEKLVLENTQIKLKKQLVEAREKNYRNLFEVLPTPVLITKNNVVSYINQAGIKALNLPKNRLYGQSFTSLFHPVEFSEPGASGEYKYYLKDGGFKYFDVHSIPTLYRSKAATLYVLNDLTEQKLAEKMMIKTEKLNIAGQLAAGIAHEIRNPLTSIKGFFQLLKQVEDQAGYFDIIEEELSRVEQIAGELLILAKSHADQCEESDLIKLLNNVKTLLVPEAGIKNIKIKINKTDDVVLLECDKGKIKQVFINLIKNAIDVMANGEITIDVKQFPKHVQISVIDQGVGMSKELQQKVGEPFYTTKDKGTGLGLTICNKIIASHNGTMKVESEVGKGTTFTLTLPIRGTSYGKDVRLSS